ncbi:MAG: hypothetical protein IJS62_05165 [Bacteroidales bacterium]|nr:hypothetical protein [Bacteroidales bacterium]
MKPVGTLLLKMIFFPLSKLPLRVHYFLAGGLAWLAGTVVRYRKSDVLINLSRAFPDKNYQEIKAISRDFYRHFADIFAEAVWFGGCRNPERLRRARIMEVVNPEALQGFAAGERSIMVMYSHCGNWELFGGIENYFPPGESPFTEQNFCVVYKKMSSAAWDAFFRDNRFAPLRDRKHYGGYLESRSLVRYIVEHRGEKKCYNVNTDQRPYYRGSDNIEVSFMGQRCRTMSASAALARKFGMSVYFLRMDTTSVRGHYQLKYIPLCEDASTLSVQEIMDKYYALLETEIREQPANYLWSHRRWKK